jgi:hypothetical protein
MKRSWHLIAGIPWLGALLAFCVLYSSASDGQDQPPPDQKWVCPLSDDQQQKAPKAFATMTPTFQTPRCINCHGVVNPFTGVNHGGGQQKGKVVEGWVERVKGNDLEAAHDVVHPSYKVYRCSKCHIHVSPWTNLSTGWRIPGLSFSFVGKDSVQLCRQMRQTVPNAQSFVDHVAKDEGNDIPFIQIGFEGTRDLNSRGQAQYQYKTGKVYKPEPPPPPITHANFIAQAQGWVDAMGGKFRGDPDCGCVPHHYSLSIDMKSNSDFHVADSASHTEMSIHTEIPLEFKDDGSFETEGQMSWVITGYQRMLRRNCDFNGSLDQRFKMKGWVDEDKQKLHLEFTNSSATQSGTTHCSDGTGGTTSNPYPTSTTSMPFDMPYFVGEVYDVPMPGQNPPAFTSSTKLKINQKD